MYKNHYANSAQPFCYVLSAEYLQYFGVELCPLAVKYKRQREGEREQGERERERKRGRERERIS